jgi:hypothetical protein
MLRMWYILDDCLKKYGRMCPSTLFLERGVIQCFDARDAGFAPIRDEQSVCMSTHNLGAYCSITLQYKSIPAKHKDVSPILSYLR